jgi:16S rRNA (cytosine1402-N4)-methyltransferase
MHQNKHKNTNRHQPVLLQEVLTYLTPQQGDTYLDVTAGYAGHASEILARTQAPQSAVLVDRDTEAIEYLQTKCDPAVTLLNADFLTAAKQLEKEGKRFDCILADLGVSSPHFDKTSRGFSVQTDEPLDMRMDQRQSLTAADILNSYGEVELIELLKEYGEEPKARQIAKRIIEHRPLATTKQLADIAVSVWGRGKKHPATRTFQALRIAVNDELGLLKAALPIWVRLLSPGGRIAIISFHSLEDRIVKQAFAERSGKRYDAQLKLLTKKPVTARPEELVFNPRARSAKLRAAAKINTKNTEGQ